MGNLGSPQTDAALLGTTGLRRRARVGLAALAALIGLTGCAVVMPGEPCCRPVVEPSPCCRPALIYEEPRVFVPPPAVIIESPPLVIERTPRVFRMPRDPGWRPWSPPSKHLPPMRLPPRAVPNLWPR
jgi:hypothetical protein